MLKGAEWSKLQRHQNEPLEITVLDNSEKNNSRPNKLAPSIRTPKLENLKPKPTDYYSEQDQFVEKQTHARNLNLFNPVAPSTTSKNPTSEKQAQEEENSKEHDEGDLTYRKNQNTAGQSGPVASDPLLYEDAELGSITALNAQGMQFYAFQSRIQGPIVNNWVAHLRSAQMRWNQKQIEQLAGRDWITAVEVILDSQGRHQRTIIVRSCGIPEIDEAAASVFSKIAYFPNPPREMVQSDQTVRLKYAFNFHVPPLKQISGNRF